MLDRRRSGRRAVDHDGTDRVTEQRTHRDFGVGIDLQMVDQRTDHAGDTVELESAAGAAPRQRGARALSRACQYAQRRRRQHARRRRPIACAVDPRRPPPRPRSVTVADATRGATPVSSPGAASSSSCSTARASQRAPRHARERAATRVSSASIRASASCRVASSRRSHPQVVGIGIGCGSLGEHARWAAATSYSARSTAAALSPRASRPSALSSATCREVDRVGDERLDHTFVGRGGQLALHAPRFSSISAANPATRSRSVSARTSHSPRSSSTDGGERVLGLDHRVVEVAQPGAQLRSRASSSARPVAQALDAGLQARDLVTGEVQPDGAQLVDDGAVALGGLGLALQRGELAPDLAQEVVEPQEVALGRVEAALGPLLALPVLQDAGRLLDDRAAIVGPGVQDRVELALADDDVLLTADDRCRRGAPGCRGAGRARR